ncbi:hypothetical protein DYH09_22720 [bacterium CPR1]|nr:hypothetical protein [bacterium CPR1]
MQRNFVSTKPFWSFLPARSRVIRRGFKTTSGWSFPSTPAGRLQDHVEYDSMEIAKVVKKYKMGEEPTDFGYWQSRPMEERLEALLQIRQHYHEWQYGTEPGFERVLTITRKTPR